MDPNAVGRIRSPFQGEVVSVTANNVIVKSARGTAGRTSGRTISFTIKPEAKVVRDGKTCELKDLQKGDAVSVVFTTKPGSSLPRVTQVSVGKSE
ncbi:MAG: hypothetical protein HZA88_11240 [Verrucomicrobia bacterium]|nr:hypothetical protein [Verrucomicrobiota bacterium]